MALGDSFTEGLVDAHPDRPDDFVGWADRVAAALAVRNAQAGVPFGYANLAIRGRLIDAVIGEQLEPALALRPDLVSLSAGGNDVLRPRVSLPAVMERLEEATLRIRETGADVMLVTAPDVSWAPLVNRVHPRMVEYTAHLWAVGQRTGDIRAVRVDPVAIKCHRCIPIDIQDDEFARELVAVDTPTATLPGRRTSRDRIVGVDARAVRARFLQRTGDRNRVREPTAVARDGERSRKRLCRRRGRQNPAGDTERTQLQHPSP